MQTLWQLWPEFQVDVVWICICVKEGLVSWRRTKDIDSEIASLNVALPQTGQSYGNQDASFSDHISQKCHSVSFSLHRALLGQLTKRWNCGPRKSVKILGCSSSEKTSCSQNFWCKSQIFRLFGESLFCFLNLWKGFLQLNDQGKHDVVWLLIMVMINPTSNCKSNNIFPLTWCKF